MLMRIRKRNRGRNIGTGAVIDKSIDWSKTSYRDLQAMAKANNIRANQTADELREALSH